MATLYITEIAAEGQDGNAKKISLPLFPPVAEQTLAIAGASAASAAFNAATTIVRLCPDAICSVKIDAAPVATAANMRLAANQEIFLSVPRGSGLKVAVITNT